MRSIGIGVPHLPERSIAAERHRTLAALSGLCLLAFALRLLPVLLAPSLNWADEIFQATEQAHRLVYGNGLVPWEFRAGARSWLLPGAIAGVMEFATLFGDGPKFYLPIIAAACSLLALAPVICCFLWARRCFGLAAAMVGGLAVAVAPELIYFGPRTFSEAIAAHLLVLGIYLVEPGMRIGSRRRLAAAGAILALACVLRIQLAPAVAFIGLWTIINGPREHAAALGIGGGVVLLLAGVLDVATSGYPFASAWRYLLFNTYYGVSSSFGTEPWYWYARIEFAIWGPGLCVLLIAAMLGWGRVFLPLVAAAIILATHSLIAHKEYRFIYPALVLIAVQAGLGLASAVDWAAVRLGRLPIRRMVARGALAGCLAATWGSLSLAVWNGPALAGLRQVSRDHLAGALFASGARGVCGIALYDPSGDAWARFGGYAYLHQPVPIYWSQDEARLGALATNADLLIYAGKSAPRSHLPAGFQDQRCFGAVCVARRGGICVSAPMASLPEPPGARH